MSDPAPPPAERPEPATPEPASPSPGQPTAERHVPVLLDRVVAQLGVPLQREGAVALDATLGLGGHAEALLSAAPRLRLIGIDRDPAALELAASRLTRYQERISLHHARFDAVEEVLSNAPFGPGARGVDRVDGVLFDLGVSSLQIDERGRGFAYAQDAPLDMRMDPSAALTAAAVLNTYDAAALVRIFRDYGEERFARRIAAGVVREREREPFTTSARLVEVIRAGVPAAARRTGGHPAKRVFQALRIEVNAELAALERALPAAIAALRVGGRIAVLSYHSLEDRIVKGVFAAGAASRTPLGLPVELPGSEAELHLVTRGAERPTEEEVRANPRAASARLRVAERVREAA